MNENTALISYACKAAMELDSNLPHLVNRQDVLLGQVEGIIRLFSRGRDHLLSQGSTRVGHEPYQTAMETLPLGVGESVRDVVASSNDSKKEVCGHDMDVAFSARQAMSQGSVEAQADSVEPSGGFMSSAWQRTRRRSAVGEKWTIMLPAPHMGNMDLPPEDGHSWRKYGQKDIHGRKYPRAYYRCTHQKLYNCAAKKHAQRLDDNPGIFEITYDGSHTCQMATTSPAATMSREAAAYMIAPQQLQASSSADPSTWLSMDLLASSSVQYNQTNMGTNFVYDLKGHRPPNVEHGEDDDYHHVVDMADVMFNAGSSTTNSIENIFPFTSEDKMEWKDRKT